MVSKIIRIGNSKGVRIPKPLIEASGISENIEFIVKKGEIRIISAPKSQLSETTLLSQKSLAKDWSKTEEDRAWASLQ